MNIFGKMKLPHDLCFVVFAQGKTQKMKPGVKEAKAKLVPVLAKGPPAQPLEDISMRIYLCDGLLGTFQMTDVLERLWFNIYSSAAFSLPLFNFVVKSYSKYLVASARCCMHKVNTISGQFPQHQRTLKCEAKCLCCLALCSSHICGAARCNVILLSESFL